MDHLTHGLPLCGTITGLTVFLVLLVSMPGGGATLTIEDLTPGRAATRPADITIPELAAMCAASESKLHSGMYECVRALYQPADSRAMSADYDSVSELSTQTLVFRDGKWRTKRTFGNFDGQIVYDDEWAFDGELLRSLSDTLQGSKIQKDTGQSHQIPNWFRELRSPLGFANKGTFGTWIADLYAKYPNELKIYVCEHPVRGPLVVFDANPSHLVYFDPREDYTCVGQILYAYRAKGEISQCYEFEKTVKVDDFYLPEMLRLSRFGRAPDKTWVRMQDAAVHFTHWGLNPQVEDGVFTMELPAHYDFYDSINQRGIPGHVTGGTGIPWRRIWLIGALCAVLCCAVAGWNILGRRR